MCLPHAYSSSAKLSATGSNGPSAPTLAPLSPEASGGQPKAVETCVIEATRPVYAASTSTHNAKCAWNGQTYHASSRGSIVASMARTLIKAGHPDAPWQLTRDGEVVLTGGSLHRVAGLTITEDDTHGLRVQKFRRRAEEAEALAA